MKLSRKDYEFNNTRICQIMPKHVELDRVLINLYMLLKHNGRRLVARTGRAEVTLDLIMELLNQHSAQLRGFNEHPEVVKDWIYSDMLDLVFRNRMDQEGSIAAPLPLHLNAFKLRNPKAVTDYRGAEHLYSMIQTGEPTLAQRLAEFLGAGMDSASDTYNGDTNLDIPTLMIVRMVDSPRLVENPSTAGTTIDPPLCRGQSRLFAADLRRLLTYQDRVPRTVLIDYIRTACGLHLGLYLLRLFHQLSGWVRAQQTHPTCLSCPVHPEHGQSFQLCPYAFQHGQTADVDALPPLLIDMGEDYTSHMARLSRENCARHFAAISDYIQAVFTVNQIKRFAESDRGRHAVGTPPEAIQDLIALLQSHPSELSNYFRDRITEILPYAELDQEQPNIQAIYKMDTLTPLERFVALVAIDRSDYYRKYLTQQLDATLMKNQDTGLLRQGKGKRNERRWYLGSRLLELLVQLAVLEPTSTGFRSRPILIDEFVAWLRERYGLVLMPDWPDATIDDYQAFNENLRRLKERLREIGFYSDLSDAYNAQTIRPRYSIE